jgi:hypothetical protein
MKNVLFLFILISPLCFAVTEDELTLMITDEYESGKFLIYNCEKKHWACVSEENFKDCEKSRQNDFKNIENPIHTCATLNVFSRKASCEQRILFMTTHNHGTRFCIKDSWKLKTEEL